MTRRCVVAALLLASACGHSRSAPGAAPLSMREREATVADGVRISATRWDDTVIALAVAGAPASERDALRARLERRHRALTYTVVVELADRPLDRDALASPDAWWFRAGDEAPVHTDVIAIDRFPAGDGRAHLRLAFRISFARTASRDDTLRVGSAAKVAKRHELGRRVATHGVALRW
jgi:hypothetical protein